MRIKKIELKNGYKKFRNLTIDLGDGLLPKLVALVGPNGSGKSSVFDGMLYLQAAYAKIGAHQDPSFDYHSMDGDPTYLNNRQNKINITFDAGNYQVVHGQRVESGTQATIFNFRSPYRYSAELNVANLQKQGDIKLNQVGASATIHIDGKVVDNYQRLYSLIDRHYKRPKSTQSYEDVKREILSELNVVLKDVLGLIIQDHGDIMAGKGTLFFSKANQPKAFSFNVLSSGEKEVVDIILDIFIKKADYSETIYMIDEPELHINTGIQRKLLNAIVKMVPNTSQLWIATHSIGFLNAIKQDHESDSAVIWFEGNLSEEPTTLRPMRKTRENWKKVFKTALEDLTGLLAPRTIIYCEGRKEPAANGSEQGLDAKVYNMIFSEQYPDVQFISSGGATEPYLYAEIALKVLGKAFDDVELLLLRDKDINGDGGTTTKEVRDEWLRKNAKNGRMLRRREIENYLFDWEIVSKVKPSIRKVDYDSLVSDINDQDIKAKTAQIKSICGKGQMGGEEFKLELARQVTPDTLIYNDLKDIIFEKPQS